MSLSLGNRVSGPVGREATTFDFNCPRATLSLALSLHRTRVKTSARTSGGIYIHYGGCESVCARVRQSREDYTRDVCSRARGDGEDCKKRRRTASCAREREGESEGKGEKRLIDLSEPRGSELLLDYTCFFNYFEGRAGAYFFSLLFAAPRRTTFAIAGN